MLPPEEVAQDEEIFRPDGFIMFPRSDGDPGFGPPNVTIPPKSDPEVNYYHVFGREEKRHDSWRAALGEQLAQHFKLEPLSRSKAKWKLYDFPKHYILTEQRKGPARDPRTDPYLFGSQSHRFRSTKETVDHLVWLLLDPDLDPSNCHCRYCDKKPRPAGSTPKKAAQGTKRKEPLTAANALGAKRGRKSGGDTVQAETAITVKGVEMSRLTPGLNIASVPQRDHETMHELKRGEKERFRLGEVVWCELTDPIVDPSMPERRITAWPAMILDPSLESTVMDAYQAEEDDQKTSIAALTAPSKRAESPPVLGGPVQQTMAYVVNFFGTEEKVKVSESALSPFLTGFVPLDVIESDVGVPEDHPWVFKDNEFPHMNLARLPDLPTLSFPQAVIAFAFAIEAAQYLRGMFDLTDAYSGSDKPEGMLRDLGASSSTSSTDPSQPPQGNRYYQGLHFGTERIWVGDVVRLRLGVSDIRKLQKQLNTSLTEDKRPGDPEPAAIILDVDGSYAMQLASIYEDPRAPKNVRVSGEVFQIMPLSKYNAIKADLEGRIQRVEADDARDEAARQEEAKLLKARLPQPSILAGKPGFPPMPPLPPGFVMISLNERLNAHLPREIVLTIGHVAGRIYPSLGMHSDGPRVAEQLKQRPVDNKLAADEDTQLELRARLSVAGLLPGCVKAMKGSGPIHTWTRVVSLKGSLALARNGMKKALLGDEEEEEEQASPKKTPSKKKARASDVAATTETPAQPAKTVNVENGAATTSSSVGEKVAEVQKLVEAATANGSTETGTAAAAEPEQAPSSEADQAPLPPGWITRQSRNLGGWYFVHTETKKTQWERPTA